jgi:hypothetical protein
VTSALWAAPDASWPPGGPSSTVGVIPAYLYRQYAGDANVGAFFTAQNIYAQAYLDWFNGLNLPIYTGLAGGLLDLVALALYGMVRPALPSGLGRPERGPYNSFAVNSLAINQYAAGVSAGYVLTSDDTFKRVLTWAFYKGDGKVINARWLKRRISRFLYGMNGQDVPNDQTYGISVAPTGFKTWTIALPNVPESTILQAALQAGVCELPFQITWTVEIT